MNKTLDKGIHYKNFATRDKQDQNESMQMSIYVKCIIYWNR